MRILLIEDNKEIVAFLRPALEQAGFAVDVGTDGEAGTYLAHTNAYDLLIVDLMLPKKGGREICSELRADNDQRPILILSAKAGAADKADLLNCGADDYLAKPFSFAELLARVRALLRRPQKMKTERFMVDGLELDAAKHVVTRDGKIIHLTPKEFGLLEYLLRQDGGVATRAMILEHVWNMTSDPFSNTIESHVRSIRRKIDLPGQRPIIHTIRGMGYRVTAEVEEPTPT